ncbi:MAG: hypothetical protein JWM40_2931 [Frankiales bacterium]|nr:hypothetical protein [Frankiales bacterium]
MRKSTKITAVLSSTAVAVASGGVAYAFWTTTGSGTGDATASAGGGTITLYSVPGSGLSPAGSVPVVYKASSALSYSTKLQTLSVGTLSVDAGHSTCNVGDFTASAPVLVANPTVPANTSAANAVTVANGTLSLADTTSDQSACKGAVITIPVSST